jgi:hypothetical protein
MSGGGGGGIKLPDINKLPGMPGSYSEAQGGVNPPLTGDQRGQRDLLRDKLKNDKTLDDVARADLTAQLDAENSDPAAIQQKYTEILDPETTGGRDLLLRKAATKRTNQPGLKAQTSFETFLGGSSSGSRGGFL